MEPCADDAEEWRSLDHLGYSLYAVSSYGRVRNVKTNALLKTDSKAKDYDSVQLRNASHVFQHQYVRRLVALTFLEAPKTANHSRIEQIDKNTKNNHKSNLRWATRQEIASHVKIRVRQNHPVLQYTRNDEFVKKWDSMQQILEYNPSYCYENISACCREGKMTRNQAYDYKWKYESIELENEEWRTLSIEHLNDILVSNKGRVKTNVIKKLSTYGTKVREGYRCVSIKDKLLNFFKRKFVHELVAIAFLGPKKSNQQVNHKNGNKEDNNVDNLEWCSISQNMQHAFDTGLIDRRKKYKPVLKIHPESDEIVSFYESVKSAALSCNKQTSYLSRACKNTNIKYGYRWVYSTNPAYQEKLKIFSASMESV